MVSKTGKREVFVESTQHKGGKREKYKTIIAACNCAHEPSPGTKEKTNAAFLAPSERPGKTRRRVKLQPMDSGGASKRILYAKVF